MKLNNMNMKNLGLTEEFIQESKIYKDLFIGRVSAQYKNLYKVITENGEIAAEVSGKFHYSVKELSEYPAVGDFVMVDRTENAQETELFTTYLHGKVFLRVKWQVLRKIFRLSLQILIPFLYVCH